MRPEQEPCFAIAGSRRKLPGDLPSQCGAEYRMNGAGNGVDHLLMKPRIRWCRIEAAAHHDQRIVEIDALILLVAVVVVDLEDRPSRSRLQWLVRHLQRGDRSVQSRDAWIEREDLEWTIDGLASAPLEGGGAVRHRRTRRDDELVVCRWGRYRSGGRIRGRLLGLRGGGRRIRLVLGHGLHLPQFAGRGFERVGCPHETCGGGIHIPPGLQFAPRRADIEGLEDLPAPERRGTRDRRRLPSPRAKRPDDGIDEVVVRDAHRRARPAVASPEP